jgi:hypothetical protein
MFGNADSEILQVAVHYYGATTEEQEEYLSAIAAGDIVNHDHKGGVEMDSSDEKTRAQILPSEDVRVIDFEIA